MKFRSRMLVVGCLTAVPAAFVVGVLQARKVEAGIGAAYEAELTALRGEQNSARSALIDEVKRELKAEMGQVPATAASTDTSAARAELVGEVKHQLEREMGRGSAKPAPKDSSSSHAALVSEVKQQLEQEMGLVPLRVLRDRQASFVELYAEDAAGKTHYGTAGYLGHGYFITVKHAVVPLDEGEGAAAKIESIKVMYRGKEIPARIVDVGDARVEVDRGDWAVLKTKDVDLPALAVDTRFGFDFAEPVFRLGNDYSKGIILSTGYVGQRTAAGLVTCLTDGHPGVSGGGVIDRHGKLVGIPVGRMEGDYRFSFILPVRADMLRKIPSEFVRRSDTDEPVATP